MNMSFPKQPFEAPLHRRLGLGFVLGLAACGGGGEPAGTAATPMTPPSAATCGSHGAFPSAAALSWNALLTQAAEAHSQDMAANDFFAHNSFDGRTFDQRITASGYNWSRVAENIAAGQTSVDEVMAGWMASEGHCVNIMNASLTEIGMVCVAGPASNDYRTYWAMDLGRPR
jgi:Cysteine-rich secretory protein family